MKVVLTTPGRFHTFALARELLRHGVLDKIFTGFPWAKVAREKIPRQYIRTAAWFQTPRFALNRVGLCPKWLDREMGILAQSTIDRYAKWRMGRPDIYLALSGSGFVSGPAAQANGAKYICDRGSSHILFQDQILREEYRRYGVNIPSIDPRTILRELTEYALADAITVPSEFVRKTFIDLGVDPRRVRKIPYGSNIDVFHPVGVRPANDEFQVLFTGAISLRKGVPYLFEAFKKLKHPRKKLVVVGMKTQDWSIIKPFVPEGDVTFLGHVAQANLKHIMSRSHVMVLPSIEEGLAVVMGEALACGCPVIATENTGAADLFCNDVEGFIVPNRAVDIITERLQLLADDGDRRMRMSEAARQRVLHMGGWRTYGDSMVALFCELTGLPS
ncbi:MAG: glycosyltransferase family 4 protein [Formivibrio sp.]|nr:glycosyltransferase family 4 protein [Formivibrio sp.]